jgi:hypothetical protein
MQSERGDVARRLASSDRGSLVPAWAVPGCLRGRLCRDQALQARLGQAWRRLGIALYAVTQPKIERGGESEKWSTSLNWRRNDGE